MTKWFTLCAALLFALLFVACDDNDKEDADIDTVADTDVVTDGTVTDDVVTDDLLTDTEETPDDDTFVIGDCTKVTVQDIAIVEGFYEGAFSMDLGDAALPDLFSIQFYVDATTVKTALTVGSYDLGAGANANFSSCTECTLAYEDIDAEQNTITKRYFQYDGALEISEVKTGTMESKGSISARLIEVTIESGTFISTPVVGGNCYEIEGTWDTICVPDCGDKVCGSDGCGGVCGDGCEEGEQCNAEGTGCIDCTPVSAKDIVGDPEMANLYVGGLVDNIGTSVADSFYLEFWGSQAAGTYDLAGTNSVDCPQCVLVVQDLGDTALQKVFFQHSGDLIIDDLVVDEEDWMTGASRGHLDGVRLVEVVINGETYESTPVAGGACLQVVSAAWDTMPEETDEDAILPDN